MKKNIYTYIYNIYITGSLCYFAIQQRSHNIVNHLYFNKINLKKFRCLRSLHQIPSDKNLGLFIVKDKT